MSEKNIKEQEMHKVLASLKIKNPSEIDEELSLGDKLSDNIAAFGGSWSFIISFGASLIIWIVLNTIVLTKAFDPYPFVFLNLMLSCVAAMQAPIIMMSQNRQAAKDRKAAENDYKTNLKNQLYLEHLHDKVDEQSKQIEELIKLSAASNNNSEVNE